MIKLLKKILNNQKSQEEKEDTKNLVEGLDLNKIKYSKDISWLRKKRNEILHYENSENNENFENSENIFRKRRTAPPSRIFYFGSPCRAVIPSQSVLEWFLVIFTIFV